MKDEELCLLSQKGDRDAQELLLNRYKNKVLAIARRFFLSGAETEDLVQEGMCGLYSAIGSYTEAKGAFAPYANACVRNRIADVVRSGTNQKNAALNNFVSIVGIDDTFVSQINPEDELIMQENRSEFYAKITKHLSSLEFKVIVMYTDGLTMAEISSAMSLSVKSVDNAITRARKKLQKYYKNA